jgi:predicted nucleotidyltransferase
MKHVYETTIIETTDGLQCKVYANSHPDTHIIVRPRYIPQTKVKPHGLTSRFIFGETMTRFNPFASKEKLLPYLQDFRKHYGNYIYYSPFHKRDFFAVPVKKIKKIYDSRKGLLELLKLQEKELDSYLILVRELISFLTKSGVSDENLGLTNSTLLGNYTFGKSDIDIVVFGKHNGWKILKFLENHKHPLLKWKSDKEWREYYRTHKTSEAFRENEFVKHNLRKRNEGLFGKHVFTLFCVEEAKELWSRWGKEKYDSLKEVKITANIADDWDSIVRPARYKLKNVKIVSRIKNKEQIETKIREIVTYSLPFMFQAQKEESIEANGLLEIVHSPNKSPFFRVVVGYPNLDPKNRDRGYIKTIF